MAIIPKKGALSILGVIAAILLFVTGMFWMMSVFFLVFGLIADFICASADFRSFKKNLLAYCVMALAPMGAYIPMVVMPAQFDAFMKNPEGSNDPPPGFHSSRLLRAQGASDLSYDKLYMDINLTYEKL